MAYSQDSKDSKMWLQKESRELFCKTVNTCLMSIKADQPVNLDDIHKIAKDTVDKAFSLYPTDAKVEEEENPFNFPEKEQ